VYKLKKRKNIPSYIKIKNKQCCFVFCLLRQPLCFCLLVWFLNKRGFVLHLLRLRALAIFLCLSTTSQHLFFLCQRLQLLISTPYFCASQQHLNIFSVHRCQRRSSQHLSIFIVPSGASSSSSISILKCNSCLAN